MSELGDADLKRLEVGDELRDIPRKSKVTDSPEAGRQHQRARGPAIRVDGGHYRAGGRAAGRCLQSGLSELRRRRPRPNASATH